MAFRNSFSKRFIRVGSLVGLLALALWSCDTQKLDLGVKSDSTNGHVIWHSATKKIELSVEIGKLVRTGTDSAGTFHFTDSIVVTAKDKEGNLLTNFRSREGQTTFPFDKVIFRDFLWECADSSEIEGSDLTWHRGLRLGIEIEGELQVVTKIGLVQGEYLVGDALLRSYEIGHVSSAVRWDELAGGREAYQNDN